MEAAAVEIQRILQGALVMTAGGGVAVPSGHAAPSPAAPAAAAAAASGYSWAPGMPWPAPGYMAGAPPPAGAPPGAAPPPYYPGYPYPGAAPPPYSAAATGYAPPPPYTAALAATAQPGATAQGTGGNAHSAAVPLPPASTAAAAGAAASAQAHTCTLHLDFQPPASYNPVPEILGPDGSYLKHIEGCASGVRVQLLGRGAPGAHPSEAAPLHLALSAPSAEALEAARSLASDLLRAVRDNCEKKHGPLPPAAAAAPGSAGGNAAAAAAAVAAPAAAHAAPAGRPAPQPAAVAPAVAAAAHPAAAAAAAYPYPYPHPHPHAYPPTYYPSAAYPYGAPPPGGMPAYPPAVYAPPPHLGAAAPPHVSVPAASSSWAGVPSLAAVQQQQQQQQQASRRRFTEAKAAGETQPTPDRPPGPQMVRRHTRQTPFRPTATALVLLYAAATVWCSITLSSSPVGVAALHAPALPLHTSLLPLTRLFSAAWSASRPAPTLTMPSTQQPAAPRPPQPRPRILLQVPLTPQEARRAANACAAEAHPADAPFVHHHRGFVLHLPLLVFQIAPQCSCPRALRFAPGAR